MSASPIVQKKSAQGYQSASTRKRCSTCGNKTNNYGADMMSCGIGRFIVTAYSICEKWIPMPPPGFKRPSPAPAEGP